MIDNSLEHFVGFANPDIIFEVGETKCHSFLDCTFSIVPVMFSQLLVFMLYFSKFDLYVPFYFVLMTVKKSTNRKYIYSISIYLSIYIYIYIY